MKEKFKTPVSMRVTQAQFEADLEPTLIALGYIEKDIVTWADWVVLATNFMGKHNVFSNVNIDVKESNGRKFIEGYNPELFLKLAAETTKDFHRKYHRKIVDN